MWLSFQACTDRKIVRHISWECRTFVCIRFDIVFGFQKIQRTKKQEWHLCDDANAFYGVTIGLIHNSFNERQREKKKHQRRNHSNQFECIVANFRSLCSTVWSFWSTFFVFFCSFIYLLVVFISTLCVRSFTVPLALKEVLLQTSSLYKHITKI